MSKAVRRHIRSNISELQKIELPDDDVSLAIERPSILVYLWRHPEKTEDMTIYT